MRTTDTDMVITFADLKKGKKTNPYTLIKEALQRETSINTLIASRAIMEKNPGLINRLLRNCSQLIYIKSPNGSNMESWIPEKLRKKLFRRNSASPIL